jgi:hypothetical protein
MIIAKFYKTTAKFKYNFCYINLPHVILQAPKGPPEIRGGKIVMIPKISKQFMIIAIILQNNSKIQI